MAKFLDKKERVIDFQLTPYGKHRLSVGQLKPEYYAFFDTGVLYDSEYAGFKEVQTKIHERIKTETQFIEGILLFEEAENTTPESTWEGSSALLTLTEHYPDPAMAGTTYSHSEVMSEYEGTHMRRWSAEEFATKLFLDFAGEIPLWHLAKGAVSMFDLDITPQRYVPTPEILSFESAIGDARFEGDNVQAAPAWKLVTCQGEMSNIQRKDTTRYNFSSASYDNEITEFNIPQIDVDAYYTRLISGPTSMLDAEVVSEFVSETLPFKGGNTIKLVRDDITIYAEELNTELLTENFDVEVFEMTEDTGVTTMATADITLKADPIDVGDKIAIHDGINTVIFEFIGPDPSDTVTVEGNIGVAVPDQYFYNNVNRTRLGTILNLISAIRQDGGTPIPETTCVNPGCIPRNSNDTIAEPTTGEYPSPNYRGTDASSPKKMFTPSGNKGRCKKDYSDTGGCYKGTHSLNVAISPEQISNVITHDFADGNFVIKLVNENVSSNTVDPNQPISTTAASSRIEVTGFSGGYTAKGTQLKRKYFVNENPQIVDGLMMVANPEIVPRPDLTADSVDYFFNVLTDKEANAKIVCACANTFNKNSYYVDIDHDCVQGKIKEIYYDIYGSATSPEICQLPAENVTELRDLQLGSDSDSCEDDS